MNKGDLIDSIAKQTGFTKTDSGSALDAVLDAVTGALMTGDRVSLPGFGSFEARERKSRYGRNPRTGEKLYIPSARIPAFSVGNFFKNKVNSYFQNDISE